jgi:hypothetical protein
MPEYYVKIKHKRNETAKEDVIEHCNIKYFLKTLIKAGWQIVSCTRLDDMVEVESTGMGLETVEAAQSVH